QGQEAGRRAAWTASRLRGTPEPPPPYQARRCFPKLSFKEPVLLVPLPGTDRLVVGELDGRLYSFLERDDVGVTDVFLDLRADLTVTRMFGLVFHPKFAENRYCYVCYNTKEFADGGTRVSRFKVSATDPPRCLADTETVLLTWRSGAHNAGCLVFGNDGYL